MNTEEGLIQESVETGRQLEAINNGVANGARIDRGDGW